MGNNVERQVRQCASALDLTDSITCHRIYLGLTKSSCTAIGSFLDQLTLDLFFS